MIKLKNILKEFTVGYDLIQDLKSILFKRLDLDDDGAEIIKKVPGRYIVKIGDIEIEAIKPNEWRSQWYFKFENEMYKTFNPGENLKELIDLLEKRFHNIISILKKKIQKHDWYYQMSDDMRKYNAGKQSEKDMAKLYQSLGTDEQKEIFDFWNANQKGGNGYKDIEEFNKFMEV